MNKIIKLFIFCFSFLYVKIALASIAYKKIDGNCNCNEYTEIDNSIINDIAFFVGIFGLFWIFYLIFKILRDKYKKVRFIYILLISIIIFILLGILFSALYIFYIKQLW